MSRFPLVLLLFCVAPRPLVADEITFRSDAGDDVTIEARVVGRREGVLGLELSDGRFALVPETRVVERVEKDGPEPATHEEVRAQLEERFVEGRMLTIVQKPYVLGLVLASKDNDDRELARRERALAKLAKLFGSLETKFRSFTRTTRVPIQPVAFPLVVLVFESDANFDVYAKLVTGDADLAAAQIAGFYDLRSNHLVLRTSAMEDYTTLLHEGVHQQVYNRRIVRRFAPVPAWFNEGIATSFEGAGETLRNDPKVPNEKYAGQALAARFVNWTEIVREDRSFHSPRLAGEAYGGAWGLHWLLVTKYRAEYAKYVRLMSEKDPLAVDDADTRQREFEETIGVSIADLEKEFPDAVRLSLRRKQR